VIIIGLTGGIACGKSTLVKGLKDNLELKIIDCDEISRSVSLPGHGGYNYIMKILGD
jgi:dephospho-CoA kinase